MRISQEEQAQGLLELKAWVRSAGVADWLVTAAERATDTASLALALGPPSMALCRCQVLMGDLRQPLYSRRLFGHMARVLCQRLALAEKGRGGNVPSAAQ